MMFDLIVQKVILITSQVTVDGVRCDVIYTTITSLVHLSLLTKMHETQMESKMSTSHNAFHYQSKVNVKKLRLLLYCEALKLEE